MQTKPIDDRWYGTCHANSRQNISPVFSMVFPDNFLWYLLVRVKVPRYLPRVIVTATGKLHTTHTTSLIPLQHHHHDRWIWAHLLISVRHRKNSLIAGCVFLLVFCNIFISLSLGGVDDHLYEASFLPVHTQPHTKNDANQPSKIRTLVTTQLPGSLLVLRRRVIRLSNRIVFGFILQKILYMINQSGEI